MESRTIDSSFEEKPTAIIQGKSFGEISVEAETYIADSYNRDYHYDPKAADYMKERRQKLIDTLLYQDLSQIRKGYDVILETLKDPAGIEELSLEEEQLELLNHKPEEGHNLQELLGYSDKLMAAIFYLIDGLYEQGEYEKSNVATKFLIALYPSVPSYWTGLGNTLLASGNEDDALKAFEMGVILGYQKIGEIIDKRAQKTRTKDNEKKETGDE